MKVSAQMRKWRALDSRCGIREVDESGAAQTQRGYTTMWITPAFFLALVIRQALARNYEVVFERIEGYERNADYFGPETSIRIRRSTKAATPGLYHHLQITKALPLNTVVEVILYEMQNNKLVPSWLKYKNNFCDYITKEKRPIFDSLAKIYRFDKCPLLGSYKIEDWRPDDKLLPPVMPGPDRMMFQVRLTSGDMNIMKYGVLFLVDRHGKARSSSRSTHH